MIADKKEHARLPHCTRAVFVFLCPIKILYDAKMHSVNLSKHVQPEKNVFKPTPRMQTVSLSVNIMVSCKGHFIWKIYFKKGLNWS